jgi:parvulin-like peptidyl-prolyl isomerase
MWGRKMQAIRYKAILLLAALSASAQVASHAPTVTMKASTAAAAVERPVARVNGVLLSDHDLLRQMLIAFPYARQHGGKFPKEMEADIRRNALDQIVFEELVWQEAQRRKMTVTPARLNQALSEFKKQFNSAAEYKDYLKLEMGGSAAKLRERVSRAILIEDLLNTEVAQKSKISNLELKKFYNTNQGRFTMPESVSIQTISFVIPDNATATQKAEIRKKAAKALSQAQAAKDYTAFGMLAEKVSEDDWRVMMGDHKVVHRGRMPPPVEKAVFSMQPGQVSDIIETENSFCIARVNTRETPKLIPYEKIRLRLKKDMESDRADQLRKSLEARLRKNSKIEEL